MHHRTVSYSAIVLLRKPRKDFVAHIEAILRIFNRRKTHYELIIIANGTEHYLEKVLPQIKNGEDNVKVIALNKSVPEAVCLKAGFKESRGEVIVVFGSYQQITEASFDDLLDALDPDTDIISPRRIKRVDPLVNRVQSHLFNLVIRTVTGVNLHDLSCTVKIFRREVLARTDFYGNLYRFLPILAEGKGFRNKEVFCEHHQEYGKIGFFGTSVYFERLIDIVTLYFNTRFSRTPFRFFSSFGLIFAGSGLVVFGYVLYQRLFMGIPLGGRMVLLLAILFLVMGIQFSSIGLIGEIIAFAHGRLKKEYVIERTTGIEMESMNMVEDERGDEIAQ